MTRIPAKRWNRAGHRWYYGSVPGHVRYSKSCIWVPGPTGLTGLKWPYHDTLSWYIIMVHEQKLSHSFNLTASITPTHTLSLSHTYPVLPVQHIPSTVFRYSTTYCCSPQNTRCTKYLIFPQYTHLHRNIQYISPE